MEFKSKICTNREQSKRLLALGLKPETADMVYHYTKSRVPALEWELQTKPPTSRGKFWTPQRIAKLAFPFHKHPDGTSMTGEEVFDELWGKDVPAWSLSRLLELIPKCIKQSNRPNADLKIDTDNQYWFISYEELGFDIKHQIMNSDLFESIISMIDWLIDNGHFNKDYLL
ncbi:hypothetical protein ACNANS_18130 [Phocaeicola vulgatus]|jgi:hypothetical protein|uniref:hypothetical protein n=1 Tax=Phocaeicola vulgatus TaxID=821 RepID=UPI003AB5E4A6